MEKLELKHLAGYLPYGIKIQNGKEFDVITGISIENIESSFRGTFENISMIKDIKPILRPLSDLTKPITIKGITFIPIKHNAFKHDIESIIEFQNGFLHYKGVKYGIIERLIEWHFDIYGLINKGLAIDINTLK